MPPKRSASATAVKTESPSRRKVGRPKKVEPEAAEDDVADDEAEQEVEEPAASPPTRRRGRRKARANASMAELEDDFDDGAAATVVTLNMEDLIDLPTDTTSSPAKKRKAPAKSSATKKNKSETSMSKELGAGDVENLIQCSLCDAKVVQLVRHIRAQHGDDPDYDSKIKEARSLEAKVQSSAPKKSSTNLLDDLTITVNSKIEKTPIVDRRTTGERGNSLVRPKNTQCPICEKVVRRYDLNKHIRNVHSGEKPNKCPYCEYASPWKGNLNTHIAGVHTKARLHDCIRCGLSFKTRSAMIGHVRKVHDKMYQPKERLFECEECNKKFYKKFHLQRHIRVHTGEKPFTCAFCEKMFASKTNMDSHIQSVHLKIKPFKCGYCEKGFARKKMMLVHIRKYHMNKDDATLMGLSGIDDITLDDNMGDDSDASVESGEILVGDDGVADSGMVLVKMRGKVDDDDDTEGMVGIKQYMFVPADELPSDLDNTMNTTMNTTGDADQSLDITNQSLSTPATSQPAAATEVEAADDDEPEEEEEQAKQSTSEPLVIKVGAGQVVQAVQTKEGIVLVTQPSDNAAKTDSPAKPATAAAEAAAEPAAAVTEVAEKEAAPEQVVSNEVEKPADNEPDLVQQALAQSVPEGVEVKSAGMLNTETDVIGGLPANLLATEEADQTETAAGEKTVETFFLSDIQTNGN